MKRLSLALSITIALASTNAALATNNTTFQLSILDEQCYIDLVEGGGNPYIFVQPEDCPRPGDGGIPLPPVPAPSGGGGSQPFSPGDINQIPLTPGGEPSPEIPITPGSEPAPQAEQPGFNLPMILLLVLGIVIGLFLLNALSIALGGPGIYWFAGKRRRKKDLES